MQKFKIILTGPESTGKTTLCKHLAEKFNTVCLTEYARFYVENLKRPYNYDDVVHIAKKQIELEYEYLQKANKVLFVDTSLIITKIWFEVVFKKEPLWLADAIRKMEANRFLLLYPDIEWKPDSVRENPGEKRVQLFKIYRKELEFFGFDYKIINGRGEKRLKKAETSVKDLII